MPSYVDLNSEVWVGAGAAVTMIPESHIFLGGNCTRSGKVLTKTQNTFAMVPGVYVGCTVKMTEGNDTQYAVIQSHNETQITFSEAINTDLASGSITAWIQPFGAPSPAPKPSTTANREVALLSDNWLGLVTTFSPPSVEAELAQLNLALAGTRNFRLQYKKAETVSGASLDMAMSNGAWLYYALGKITSISHDATTTALSSCSAKDIVTTGDDKPVFHRVLVSDNGGKAAYPPTNTADAALYKLGTDNILYTFGEANGQDLPSFSLEMTYEKEGIIASEYYVGSNSRLADSVSDDSIHGSGTQEGIFSSIHNEIFCRVFTGCQVNSMTINFEEGQEVTQSLDLVTRRAFDVPNGYHPKRNVRTGSSDDLDNFMNYYPNESSRSAALQAQDKQPYMFSKGELTLLGQTVTRVKSGSLTITNNITPQRYIGNYNSEITSQHIPAQRTYELSLTMLVTDSEMWNEMRASSGETLDDDSKIILQFSKDGGFDYAGDKTDDYFTIELRDIITQSVDMPFPEDKGPLEINATFSARTLENCQYSGNWVILNNDN
tara:strand:+ start:35 stop:1681 length:1647 start_codon:yes stop_codon:yes gene_type:complete